VTKVEQSILLIQKAEPLALQYSPDGFHLAFSGGKDSQVIYELCKMAGVKFKAVMQVTTIDPPELMKFVRKNYPDVILERPEINFYKLIIKKHQLPTRVARFCCQYLKEQAGSGTVTILGIRRAESSKRAKRNEIEISKHKYSDSIDQFNIDSQQKIICINGKDKIMLNPIITWSNSDVWNFIRNRNIEYCNLYDKGYHRIGCMFCLMASKKIKQLDRKNYPGIEKLIKQSIQKCIELHNYGSQYNLNADEIFDWWISNDSMKKYVAQKQQTKIEFNN
jgi:phosphoadenosine phosphosulfate reductase